MSLAGQAGRARAGSIHRANLLCRDLVERRASRPLQQFGRAGGDARLSTSKPSNPAGSKAHREFHRHQRRQQRHRCPDRG